MAVEQKTTRATETNKCYLSSSMDMQKHIIFVLLWEYIPCHVIINKMHNPISDHS